MTTLHPLRLSILAAALLLPLGTLASSHEARDHSAHHPPAAEAPAAGPATAKGCPMMSGGMKHDMQGGMGMHQMMQARIEALEKRVDLLQMMLQMQMHGGMHPR
jgi:hypothetical protein